MEEKAPVNDFGRTVLSAAAKIGNSVISLLRQLRCHCNLDHNKFSSLADTTVVAIFPNLCLRRRSLCSNLGGIDPQKLYRATLTVFFHWMNERKYSCYQEYFIIHGWSAYWVFSSIGRTG